METELKKLIKREMIKDILLSSDFKKSISEKESLLFTMIPELKSEVGFKQNNPYHVYDVWNHTIEAVNNSNSNLITRLTLLLHDIGKPHSYQDDGEIRHFKGHDKKSAKISKRILKELGYDERVIDEICFYIENHSKDIDIENINKDNIHKYKKLLYIQYCDASAYNPEYVKPTFEKLDKIKEKIEEKEKQIKKETEIDR